MALFALSPSRKKAYIILVTFLSSLVCHPWTDTPFLYVSPVPIRIRPIHGKCTLTWTMEEC